MAAAQVSKDILLYNKVKLADGTVGIVRYIGGIMGKKGLFVGLDVTKGKGKNDGSFKDVRYFTTKKGAKTGRFTKMDHITKTTQTSHSIYPLHWGESVHCTETNCKGTVRSIGVPSWDDAGNVHYGLELSKQKGPHDGTRDGVAYFVCKPQHGIYIEAQEGGSGDTAKRKKKKKKKKKEPADDALKKGTKSSKGSKTKSGRNKEDQSPPNKSMPKRDVVEVDDVKNEEMNQQRADKVRRERIQRMKEMERQEREQRELQQKEERELV